MNPSSLERSIAAREECAPHRATTSPILEIEGLCKTYGTGSRTLKILHNVDLKLDAGDTCAVVGPSGSGKSTLLGLCAGLDGATSGSVRLLGQPLEDLDEDQRAALRNEGVGFVFQSFQLLPTLTALENVLVPLELSGISGARAQACAILEQVGLGGRFNHYPLQLSGGEQQRVALARAFIRRPRILLADEPTGNLDADTSAPIVEMLFEMNRAHGTALLLVTHDPALAARARRIVRMRAGSIERETTHERP